MTWQYLTLVGTLTWAPAADEVIGIQAFVLLDTVEPRGGGTVALSGSHKLHRQQGGVVLSAHHVLQRPPLYSALYSPSAPDRHRLFTSHLVDGVAVQVVEMCGVAGDVYLMDMRTVHAAAPNASKIPRMMLTSRYLKPR